MNLMLAKTPWVVIPIYPLVAAGGMLHASCVFGMVSLATPAAANPSWGKLVLCSLIYTAFLSMFFRIMDGGNLLFQLASFVTMSAIFSIVLYPLFHIVGQAVSGVSLHEGAAHGWLGVSVLVVSLICSIAFIYGLGEHDLHHIGLSWIFLSQLTVILCGLGFVMWEMGILQAMWAAMAGLFSGKPVPAIKPSP